MRALSFGPFVGLRSSEGRLENTLTVMLTGRARGLYFPTLSAAYVGRGSLRPGDAAAV